MEKKLSNLTFLEVDNTSKYQIPKSKGVLTIINDTKNGNGYRITLSKQLETDLGLKETLQIAITEDGKSLILGENLDVTKKSYPLKRANKRNPNSKFVIYNKMLVKQIVEKMELDYSDCCSVTFYGIEYIEEDGKLYAEVWKEGENCEL